MQKIKMILHLIQEILLIKEPYNLIDWERFKFKLSKMN